MWVGLAVIPARLINYFALVLVFYYKWHIWRFRWTLDGSKNVFSKAVLSESDTFTENYQQSKETQLPLGKSADTLVENEAKNGWF